MVRWDQMHFYVQSLGWEKLRDTVSESTTWALNKGGALGCTVTTPSWVPRPACVPYRCPLHTPCITPVQGRWIWRQTVLTQLFAQKPTQQVSATVCQKNRWISLGFPVQLGSLAAVWLWANLCPSLSCLFVIHQRRTGRPPRWFIHSFISAFKKKNKTFIVK